MGKSQCWYNSWIPATVCVGAVFHSDIQAEQFLSRSSSLHRFAISFPCHFSSSISSFRLLWSILRSSAFPPPHLLWCGQLILVVVGPASFLSLQHISARLSQEIAVLYGLFFFSNSLTNPIVGSVFAYKWTAALRNEIIRSRIQILDLGDHVSCFYNDFISRPPIFLGR